MSISRKNPVKPVSKMFPSAIINNDLMKYHQDPTIIKKVEKGKILLEKLKLV
jgi:hypothetical protein